MKKLIFAILLAHFTNASESDYRTSVERQLYIADLHNMSESDLKETAMGLSIGIRQSHCEDGVGGLTMLYNYLVGKKEVLSPECMRLEVQMMDTLEALDQKKTVTGR
jgi:hypothetical protein